MMIRQAGRPVQSDDHINTPACTCQACLEATAQADRRRAEIREILARLDELELRITTADEQHIVYRVEGK